MSEKEQLLSFLKTAYPDNSRMSDERFWEWHFLKSPYVEPDNMPIWVVKDADKIVGQLAAIPVKLKVGDEEKSAVWILDFIVDENYRGRGLGKKLVLAAEQFCPLGLGVNTDEQSAPLLLQKLGWKIVRKIPRYNRLLFPGSAVKEIARVKPLRELINTAFAPFRLRFPQNHLKSNGTVRIVENFDSAFDELWEESKSIWSCAVRRSSAILNWQYFEQPGKKFDILGFYENEKLRGYAVLFFRKTGAGGALPKAAITDICCHPDKAVETIDGLLRASLQMAVERRAGTLVTDVIDATIQARLEKFGFRRTKNPLQLMVKSGEKQETIYNAENWFLTRGDADISIFEHPNL